MLENVIYQQRFFIPKVADKLNDAAAEILFRQEDDVLIIDSIRVIEAFGGQGIAGKLVEIIIEKAQKENLHIYPICPYAVNYLGKRPDLENIVLATHPTT